MSSVSWVRVLDNLVVWAFSCVASVWDSDDRSDKGTGDFPFFVRAVVAVVPCCSGGRDALRYVAGSKAGSRKGWRKGSETWLDFGWVTPLDFWPT